MCVFLLFDVVTLHPWLFAFNCILQAYMVVVHRTRRPQLNGYLAWGDRNPLIIVYYDEKYFLLGILYRGKNIPDISDGVSNLNVSVLGLREFKGVSNTLYVNCEQHIITGSDCDSLSLSFIHIYSSSVSRPWCYTNNATCIVNLNLICYLI